MRKLIAGLALLCVAHVAQAAWAFGTAGTVDTKTLSAGVATSTCPYPASISAGDILLVGLAIDLDGRGTYTTPGGWTNIESRGDKWGTIGKVASGSESGSLSVNWAGTSGAEAYCVMVRYTGGTLTLHTSATTTETYVSPDVTLSNLTISQASTLVFSFGRGTITGTNPAAYTPPASFTERVDATAGTIARLVVGDWIQTTATNVSGSPIWDTSTACGVGCANVSVTISLTVAAGGGANPLSGPTGRRGPTR